jgi:hypothetical protein
MRLVSQRALEYKEQRIFNHLTSQKSFIYQQPGGGLGPRGLIAPSAMIMNNTQQN